MRVPRTRPSRPAGLASAARRVVRRLRGCPEDCGEADPAPRYGDLAWPDDVSPDQARIEAVLEGLVTPEARVLHVGVGTSHLARRFAGRVARIDGVTVVPEEAARAAALGLPRYRVLVANKYGPAMAALSGPYDLVVDNNPTSYACCRAHVAALIGGLGRRLVPGGRILTDATGLAYHAPRGFGLGWAGWAALGGANGLVAEALTTSVWALRSPGARQ